jgi:phage terminase large subunit GpA-like protein
MRTKIFALCILSLLLAVTASAQDNKSIVAHANGDGTLKIGDEKFKVSTVVIKLFEDNKAEINLVSDITIFVSGTWSWKDDSKQVINLKISGGATGGGIEANGELFLRDSSDAGQRRAIDRVSLDGTSKTTHRGMTLNFQAKS